MKGIDISGWQAGLDAGKIDADFIIIKATEGIGYVNPFCDRHFQQALTAGKKLGVYHFASGLDPVAEADFFIDNIQGYIGKAILVLDWEANAISRGREWVRSFVRRVKERTQVPPVIYGSASPLAAADIPGVATEENCGLWVAAYPDSNPTGYRDADQLLGSIIRQYSSKGRLAGYDGNLDLDVSTLTGEQWDKYARGQRDENSPAPAPQPERKSDDQIANEVIAGAWGNGEDRKNRLTAAGYDPANVQAIVNQKLGTQPVAKSTDQIATEVIGGLWGNGDDRRARLEAAGYSYDGIQALVNEKLGVPAQSQEGYFTLPSGPAGYLSNVAGRFGTNVAQLVVWNKDKYPNMTANYVQAGWVIRVK